MSLDGCGAVVLGSPDLLLDLRSRYGEPHRAFHTWERVTELLRMAEDVAAAVADRNAFVLAILFHRVVLDPRAQDAPIRSAAVMRQAMAHRLPAERLLRAETLIRALTDGMLPETEDASLRGDAALLLDFDHAILGCETVRYRAYEAALRQEFPHLSDTRYGVARAATLRMLGWRERIFLTDRFYLDYERRARRNIEAQIAELDPE